MVIHTRVDMARPFRALSPLGYKKKLVVTLMGIYLLFFVVLYQPHILLPIKAIIYFNITIPVTNIRILSVISQKLSTAKQSNYYNRR